MNPCDWDLESFCVVEGCRNPATHARLVGMADEESVVELVCCGHAQEKAA